MNGLYRSNRSDSFDLRTSGRLTGVEKAHSTSTLIFQSGHKHGTFTRFKRNSLITPSQTPRIIKGRWSHSSSRFWLMGRSHTPG